METVKCFAGTFYEHINTKGKILISLGKAQVSTLMVQNGRVVDYSNVFCFYEIEPEQPIPRPR